MNVPVLNTCVSLEVHLSTIYQQKVLSCLGNTFYTYFKKKPVWMQNKSFPFRSSEGEKCFQLSIWSLCFSVEVFISIDISILKLYYPQNHNISSGRWTKFFFSKFVFNCLKKSYTCITFIDFVWEAFHDYLRAVFF